MVDLDLANLFSKAFEHQVRAPIYSFKILATGQENAHFKDMWHVAATAVWNTICFPLGLLLQE